MTQRHHLSPGQRVGLGTANRLKLGLFGANMSSGTALTTIPERWVADWDENVAVAQLADAAGIDFLLPIARWKGYGGRVDPAGISHETIAWACGLLAHTKRIHIFATVHAPYIHPVFAAKQFATADHIGHGRFGLNIVVGWNDDEFDMFGLKLAPEMRYPYAREWIDCIKQLWSRDDEFAYEGEFLKLNGVRGYPKPFGDTRPLVVNAGMSPVGQAYAIECCDALFSTPPKGSGAFSVQISEVKRRAAGRNLAYPVFTSATVICRPTQMEAEDFYAYCSDNADWEAVDKMLDIRRRSGRQVPPGDHKQQRREMIKGLGDFRIIGDPDNVAAALAGLAEEGVDGIAMIFVNQKRDLPYFLAEVEPRLRKLGLRG